MLQKVTSDELGLVSDRSSSVAAGVVCSMLKAGDEATGKEEENACCTLSVCMDSIVCKQGQSKSCDQVILIIGLTKPHHLLCFLTFAQININIALTGYYIYTSKSQNMVR